MEYRELGRTGLKISPICFGTDNFANPTPEEEAKMMIDRALDGGVNLLDTGDIYADGEGERIIGRALKESGRRQQTIISTKINPGTIVSGQKIDIHKPGVDPNERGHSRFSIIRACEDSLKRLQTDHIDLYQTHRHAPYIPFEETLRAFDDLVRAGKVRYIGCSTHPAWAVMEAVMVSRMNGYSQYVSEQPPYNLLDRRIENELIPMCRKHGLGIISWSPLAMGVLAGRYNDVAQYPKGSRAELRGTIYAERVTDRGIRVGVEFVKIAKEVGISSAQLALLWCKDQPGITAPLMGPRTLEQLEHFLPVLEMELDDDTRAACDALVPPGSVAANFHNSADWMKAKNI
jgi:aryl-alcohol dehydrogenase-like predicted oxidoreductase